MLRYFGEGVGIRLSGGLMLGGALRLGGALGLVGLSCTDGLRLRGWRQ